jgi:hypothetical protein
MRKLVGGVAFFVWLVTNSFCSANALTVKFDPGIVDVTVSGPTFIVDVLVKEVLDLGSFQFDIDFDPNGVKVNSVSDVVLGAFLGSTGRTVSEVGPVIDNTAGKLTFGAFSFGSDPGPDGNGTLATVKFTIVHKIPGTLVIGNLEITDTEGEPISVDVIGNCKLVVPLPTIVPTLSEWGLIICSFFLIGSGLWLMRRRRA